MQDDYDDYANQALEQNTMEAGMQEQDIDRLYSQLTPKDVENAKIVLFCVVVGVLIVSWCVCSYLIKGGM